MRKAIKRCTVICVVACLLLISYGLFLSAPYDANIFVTNDIHDYGKYIGNYDNDTPSDFINSFFPASISNSFTDIKYHYKAKKFDTYAYEAYLEFVIDDPDSFARFLEEYVCEEQCNPFLYDQAFLEYSISNVLRIGESKNASGGYSISYADIGKILFSVDEQRIIFIALGVYDGGGTDTSELNHFFSQFDIDCNQYKDYAYFTHDDQKNGILYKDR
jgi:hypothetical protein